MGFLNIMGNSFGCSASGERLVSAARDGDLHEAKAILDCNPRLARYSTFGLRNSPLHHSAAQGHNEIVVLFLESGVDIDLRNASGQTALMQACQYGHWEVVQTLILFNANIHKTDYLNGGTAIHFAALNGHSRCIRLLLTDYVPSISNFWNIISNNDSTDPEISDCGFDESGLFGVISNPADGGVTALHMAALNGHAETVQLLLDLGGFVSAVTVEDGTSVDLIGGGSTPLHYAAYGGNAMCCRLLIARGASLDAKNANGSTPLNVARSCHRIQLEDILSRQPAGTENRIDINPSPYLSLPLMSIMKIARESVCHEIDKLLTSFDPCVVCLERKCTVSTDGCGHEFCTRCALYLCSATTTSVACPSAGSIPCPLCRHPIISFSKLQSNATPPKKLLPRPSGLALGGICGTTVESTGDSSEQLYKQPSGFNCASITPSLGSSLFRSLSCHMCPGSSMRLNPILCLGGPVTEHSLVRCSRPRLHRSVSHGESRNRWLFSFNQYEETNSD